MTFVITKASTGIDKAVAISGGARKKKSIGSKNLYMRLAKILWG